MDRKEFVGCLADAMRLLVHEDEEFCHEFKEMFRDVLKEEGLIKKPRKTKEESDKDKAIKTVAMAAIDYLNEKAGTKFKNTSAGHLKPTIARINEGYNLHQLKAVIDFKCGEWLGDAHMQKYLRPTTLFQASKFDSYLATAGMEVTRDSSITKEQLKEKKIANEVQGAEMY